MKIITKLTMPVEVFVTDEQIRTALGENIMTAAKRAVIAEKAAAISSETNHSLPHAYRKAVDGVVSAFTAYEQAKFTRDESRTLAHLDAACSGLRKISKKLKRQAVEITVEKEEN